MLITWASNAPWAPTGYGSQTRQVVRRLRAAGHDVAIASNYGLFGEVRDWEGTPVYPAGKSMYSDEVLPAHHAHHTNGLPGWIITLYDVWGYNRPFLADQRIASWLPVDHSPPPAEVIAWCREHLPIAMSRFGQRELARVGIEARYVPHGLEPVWRPTP